MQTLIHYQVKNIDPAWPVPKEAPKERVAPASVKPHKIHVNPNFVGKVYKVFFITIDIKRVLLTICIWQVTTAEDETEIMRRELLKKEQELLELKRMEVEMQINKMKMKSQMDQVILIFIITVSININIDSDIFIPEININFINVLMYQRAHDIKLVYNRSLNIWSLFDVMMILKTN